MEAGEPLLLVCAYEAARCGGRHPDGSLTLEEFERRPASVTKAQEVVFYCGCPGQETARTRARYFRSRGWTRVAVLDGGLLGWIHAGLPLEPAPEPETLTPKISWLDDLDDARELAVRSGKPLVVCYVAGWCDVCRRFRKRTLASSEVRAFTDRFHWVTLEIDRDIGAIRKHRLEATPTTDLVDPWGATRVRISGFVSAEHLARQLREFEADLRSGPVDPLTFARRDLDGAKASTEIPQGYRGAGICATNVGYGPLRLPSLSPFQSLRSGLVPRTPSTLAEGSFEVLWTESWANLWARDSGEHLVDYETLHGSVTIAYGVSDVVQVELGFVQKGRFGGLMDGFIEKFHDTFGLPQGGRDEVDRRDFALEIDRDDGTPAVRLSKRDRGSFSESIVATVQHNLTCGNRSLPAVACGLTVRRELGEQENLSNGESVDLSASVSLSKRVGDWYAYAGLGYSWYGQERFDEADLRPTQLSALAAVEWQYTEGASLLLQYLVSQGPAENLREFSRPSYELTFGAKVEMAPGTLLEVGLIENLITLDNSPDFGIHAGLTRRF